MRLLVLSLLLLVAALSPREALAVEDPCIGESVSNPVAVCTDIEITEWRYYNEWSYDLGPWAPLIMECEGRGGVVDIYPVVGGHCVGPADWTDSNFVSMAQAIAIRRFPSLAASPTPAITRTIRTALTVSQERSWIS